MSSSSSGSSSSLSNASSPGSGPEVSVILTTGAGAQLPYGPPNSENYLLPLGQNQNGLLLLGPSQWLEIRSNGFRFRL